LTLILLLFVLFILYIMMMRAFSFAVVASLVTGRAPESDRVMERFVRVFDGDALEIKERRRLEASSEGTPIVALQWNPHWECFASFANRNVCAAPAKTLADNMLLEYGVDFASFIELEDSSYQPPAPYRLLGGRTCGKGHSDWATIAYDSSKWAPEGGLDSGCLPTASSTDARAYAVQRFTSLVPGGAVAGVTVAAAHFPHYYAPAIAFMGEQLRQGDGRFILMADTNLISADTDAHLYSQLGFSGSLPVSSELFNSCCANSNFPKAYTFDRILSNLDGQNPVTSLPLGHGPAPTWARATSHHGSEFHLPVVLKFEVY